MVIFMLFLLPNPCKKSIFTLILLDACFDKAKHRMVKI